MDKDLSLSQSCQFIGGGANTVGTSVVYFNDVTNLPFLVYSLSNVIAIGHANTHEVSCTLKGHAVRINSIVHVSYHETDFIVSFSDDGVGIIWRHGGLSKNWTLVCKFGSTNNPSLIGTAVSSPLGIVITIADISGNYSTYGYQDTDEKAKFISVMKVPLTQLPKALHSAVWTPSTLSGSEKFVHLLISGGVDSKVHIYCSSSSTLEGAANTSSTVVPNGNVLFTSQCALPGHEDWVGSLSSYVGEEDEMFIASGSQDTFIRIWKLKLCTSLVAGSNLALVHHPFGGEGEGKVAAVAVAVAVALEEDDEDEDGEGDAPEEESADAAPGAGAGTAGKGKKERQKKYEQTKAAAASASANGASVPKVQVKEESMTEVRASLFCSHAQDATSTSGSDFISHRLDATLDALLIGHEEWVTHVEWIPNPNPNSGDDQRFLFSTSMDRNMIIWLPDGDSGVWTPAVRIGDIGGQLGGSVGGNLLGFVGGCVLNDRLAGVNTSSILGIGYGGSFHLWRCGDGGVETGSNEVVMSQSEVLQQRWRPFPSFSGHFNSVTDLEWSCDGKYLVSVSSDQTCRVWSRVTRDGAVLCTDSSSFHWREVSRPQIHGYDLTSIALHPSPPGFCHEGTSFVLYSGSDEKVIRCFDITTNVLEQFHSLCGLYGEALSEGGRSVDRIHSAYIPELGLSNKAADLMTAAELEERKARHVAELTNLDGQNHGGQRSRLLEGQLADETIWPEVNKLFGHKNDVVCLATSHYVDASATASESTDAGAGPTAWKCMISSCKSRDAATSTLLLWDLSDRNLSLVGTLQGHDSTVVCIQFSKSNRLVASSGKDRTLCIFESVASGGSKPAYSNAVTAKSAHKRIVWDLWYVCSVCDVSCVSCVSCVFPLLSTLLFTLSFL